MRQVAGATSSSPMLIVALSSLELALEFIGFNSFNVVFMVQAHFNAQSML